MADADALGAGFALDADGLQQVTWDALDSMAGGVLTASPADAAGRGIALTVTRAGEPVDMTGAALYVAWRHRQTHARGCAPMEAADAATGTFRLFFPAAMAAAEGTLECQLVASWGARALSSALFDVRVARVMTGGATEEDMNLLVEAIKRYEEACGVALDAADAARLMAEAIRQAAAAGEFDGAPGAPGADGADGVSPAARVERTEGGALITVEDASGATEAEVRDGVSPKVAMISGNGVLTLVVTDAEGGHSATIPHGAKGDRGEPGADGTSCTHTWDGTVLTVTSASGTSSADLVGPTGPEGPRVPALWTTTQSVNASDTDSLSVLVDARAQVGDLVVSTSLSRGLGVIKKAEPHDSGKLSCTVGFLMNVRARQLCTCEGVDLQPGVETDDFVMIEGVKPGYGDYVLSTDTGCLCRISHDKWGDTVSTYALLTGITHFAMREYVDAELAKLAPPDLTAYATREYVDAALAAIPDLSAVAF